MTTLGLLAFIVVVFLIVSFAIYMATYDERQARKQSKDDRRQDVQVMYATRLIERMLAADEVMPTLPQAIRDEATKFVNKQYRQLNQGEA